MRIIIDLQGAQSSGSRNRGIGRYSQTLARYICQCKGEHEVHLVLNNAFAGCIGAIRADFAEVIAPEQIHVFDITGATREIHDDNIARRRFNETMREAFIATLQPDVVLITSLFEGLGDDAITSIHTFTYLPTAVVLYDLIPFINPDPYLLNPVVENWYLHKIDHLKRADLLLSISQSSGNEAKQYLNFDSEKVVNISTACDSQFMIQPTTPSDTAHLADTYHLTKPFVMYTGGIDYRKNIERLIVAFSALPKPLRQTYQLAIVCSVNDHDRTRLEHLADEHGLTAQDFVMTGFVPEADLVTLYNACHLFIFPSWHEGFGLPALEAMQCGRPVIGSNTSSLPEVIGLEEALFDPLSVTAITEKIEQGLTDEPFRQRLIAHGIKQAKKFSWDRIAQHTLDILEQKFAPTQTSHNLPPSASRPTLAFLSPLPPQKSGISDYSVELLEELTRWYDITVIVQDEILEGSTSPHKNIIQNSWVNANTPIDSVTWFSKHHSQFDRVLYQFGNSEFHQHMFELLPQIPGAIVLHDFYLSGVQRYRDKKGIQPNAWHANLYQSHGYHAVWVEENETYPEEAMWHYPTSLAVLQSALGIIVHSENSLRLANDWYGLQDTTHWYHIPHLRTPPTRPNKQLARQNLRLSDKDFVICSFGMMGPTKHSLSIIEAFLASSLSQNPHCHLIFVGAAETGRYGQTIASTITNATCPAHIHITGWADMEAFRQYLQATDVGIQLRTLSRGETSGTVLDCMNYGVATIVNANGSMQDLDKESVYMLPDVFSQEELITALETLYVDSGLRYTLGENAQHKIVIEHNPAQCAYQYFTAIEQSYHTHQQQLFGLIQRVNTHRLAIENTPKTFVTLADNFPVNPRVQQLFIDVSPLLALAGTQPNSPAIATGLNYLQQQLHNPPKGYRIEPVYSPIYATSDSFRPMVGTENLSDTYFWYAHDFTCTLLGIKNPAWAKDRPIQAVSGDKFLAVILQPDDITACYGAKPCADALASLANHGIQVNFLSYLQDNALPSTTNAYFISLDNTDEKQAIATQPTLSRLQQSVTIQNNIKSNGFPIPSKSLFSKRSTDTHRDSTEPSQNRQIFIDVSELIQHDAHSGIQRVVKAILQQLLHTTPAGYRIEPVYALTSNPTAHYQYAYHFTQQLLQGSVTITKQDSPISYNAGDIFLGLDLQRQTTLEQFTYLKDLQNAGVKVAFVVYDLLCITQPQYFIAGAAPLFEAWLRAVSQFDQLLCISQAVQQDAITWLATSGSQRNSPLAINYFHLGADIEQSLPSLGLPGDASQQLTQFSRFPTFLMVGTLEPRKAHAQVLDAFELLWQQGMNINLVIVGKLGWQTEDLAKRIQEHPALGYQLFWLNSISDEYLEQIYAVCTCLIAASYGEGFGLPLIEAAQHHLPIIARDIPVFKEVAGEFATYFADSEQAGVIADCIRAWLVDYASSEHIMSDAMPYVTWNQSTLQLLARLLS